MEISKITTIKEHFTEVAEHQTTCKEELITTIEVITKIIEKITTKLIEIVTTRIIEEIQIEVTITENPDNNKTIFIIYKQCLKIR